MLAQVQLSNRFFEPDLSTSKFRHSPPIPVTDHGTLYQDTTPVMSDFGSLLRLFNLECGLRVPLRTEITPIMKNIASSIRCMRQHDLPLTVAAFWIEIFSPQTGRSVVNFVNFGASMDGKLNNVKGTEANYRINQYASIRELCAWYANLEAQKNKLKPGSKELSLLASQIESRWDPAYCAEGIPISCGLKAYQEMVASGIEPSQLKMFSVAANVSPFRYKPPCINCTYALGDWMEKKTDSKMRTVVEKSLEFK
jgi:hypothetical protein